MWDLQFLQPFDFTDGTSTIIPSSSRGFLALSHSSGVLEQLGKPQLSRCGARGNKEYKHDQIW